jgi:serine/threonine-protein kinase
VVHSKEVYVPLNINQSPFNVGLPIELPEFTRDQVENLAKLYGLDLSVASIEQLMAMMGGHPELVQQAISHLNHQEVELEPLLETAPTEEGIYCNHLRRLWQSLQEYPELVEALKNVVAANSPVRLEATLLYKLHSMGLVQLQGNNCSPRCNLYRQYFCDRLGVEE